MTDRDTLKKLEVARIASNASIVDPVAIIAAKNQETFTVLLSDSATAGTAVTETVIARLNGAAKIVSSYMTAPIAVTANDTTYATTTVATRHTTGNATTVGVMTTKITAGSGNMTAFVPVALTLTNATMAAGDVLTVAVAKASTGVALTAATSYFTVTVVVEYI